MPSDPNPNPLTSQRNLMNIRQYFFFTYLLINHFKFADGGVEPRQAFSPPWSQMINAQGWPTHVNSIGGGFNAGGIRIPNASDYGANPGETYTIDPGPTGIGDADFTFTDGNWNIDNVNSVNVTAMGGNRFKTTTLGQVWKLVVGFSGGAASLPNLIAVNMVGVSTNLRDFRMYRTGDAARLASGKLFRAAALQPIVDMNPSAVRFMDWIGGNDDQNCRWENRLKPDHGSYLADYTASPAYGDADYVATAGNYHQYTLGAAVPTVGNPKITPASMTHGEIATTNILTGIARAGRANVTAIQQATTPQVTATGHPFITGDVVYHSIPTSSGMQQLDRRKCQVTVIDANTYTINIDTSSFTAFSGTAKGDFYVSLNVNNRGDFPILFSYGFDPPTVFGATQYLQAGSYTFWFDKNVSPMNNSSGTPIKGAWLFTNSGAGPGTGPQGGIPIELCTQLVLEVNELSVAQGINNPVHMWLNMPFRGLLSVDPDYSSGSNFATNMVDVALNGSTVNGVTYPGLKSIDGPSCLLECSNELWNGGGADSQGILQAAYAQAVVGKDNYNESAGYSSWRSVAMVQDVKAAFPSETRIKYVLASQGTNVGVADGFMDGGSFYGPHKLAGWPATPLEAHDAFAHAPYVDPFGDFTTPYNSNVYDDNAKYHGLDNSGALVITANATTTNTLVTTAVTNGPVVVGQVLCGAGLPNDTWVTAVGGTSPNYTLTLNNGSAGRPGVNVPSGAKISSVGLLTANASTSSNSLTVTASNVWFDGTSIGNAVRFVGPGVNVGTCFIISVSGTFPNYTLTLDRNISFAGGTIGIEHASGGDYRGAANQSAALQSFVDAVRGVSPVVDTLHETLNRYCDPAAPTAGVEHGYTSRAGFGSAGKVLVHYEGNTNWNGGHPSDGFFSFMLAVNQSSQWATATINYWNARAGQANMAMPALYGWIAGDQTTLFQEWSFATPDNYAGHIEGQNLKNTAFWPALGARNQAFNEFGQVIPAHFSIPLRLRLHA